MVSMRFKGLDLNLLVALDILLTEKNVSRAADKLCLSQSATSGALARLREYFGDEILVQVGRKMVLTPRAMMLADKVRAALVQIDGTIIQAPEFNPATAERTIRIIASDFITISLLGRVVRKIAEQAPGVTLVIEPPAIKPYERLERGEVDLLTAPEMNISPEHPSLPFISESYVVVAWSGNTNIGDKITEEEFFAAKHATVMFPTHVPTYESWFLRNRGADRKIAAVAGSFASLPFLIEGTDHLALMHRSLAEVFAGMMPLKLVPSPVEIPELVERVQWHRFSEGDECIAWVRDQIIETAGTN